MTAPKPQTDAAFRPPDPTPLTTGRVVQTFIRNKAGELEVRHADVRKVWNPTCANLVLALDGENDKEATLPGHVPATPDGLHAWVTSATLVTEAEARQQWNDGPGAAPNVCFWPPRV